MKRTIVIMLVFAWLLDCQSVTAQNDLNIQEVEAKANQGDLKSMYLMGRAYFRGVGGVTKDQEKGRQWYKATFDKAKQEADKGNKEAMDMVLTFFQKDYGGVVGRDSVEIMTWFNKALDMQFYPAQLQQARFDMYCERWTDAVNMLKKLMANPDNNKKEGAGFLGECYYYGLGGLQRNYPLAFKYFKMQIDGGRYTSKAEAVGGIGLCYYYGRGVQKNIPEAVKYWMSEKNNLNPEATYLLAYCLIKGLGTTKDIKGGCTLLKRVGYMREASDEMKDKAQSLLADTEGEIARQQYLAEQKKRQEEARRRAERERQSLIYQGPYTATGQFISYSNGSFNNYGGASLHQVKICRDIIYVDGKSFPLTRTDGNWLCYGQNQGHPMYLYNTQTGELRSRFVFVFAGVHVSDNFWVRGDVVAAYMAPPPSSSRYSSYSSSSSSPSSTGRTPKTCGLCNGRGNVPTDDGIPDFGSKAMKWCKECNKNVYLNHWHKPCPSCGGKGKW
ncbi:MAG: SEL1-like repeat protein [Bacteroidaceae bacterium]|nr:SEL1-like repeat protein [Bacteroidaceae bacterium]